jgi:hypothetical protein
MPVQNMELVIWTCQEIIFSQQGNSSTKCLVQSVGLFQCKTFTHYGYSSTKHMVKKDIAAQNVQSVRICQCRTFSHYGYSQYNTFSGGGRDIPVPVRVPTRSRAFAGPSRGRHGRAAVMRWVLLALVLLPQFFLRRNDLLRTALDLDRMFSTKYAVSRGYCSAT